MLNLLIVICAVWIIITAWAALTEDEDEDE